MSQITTHYTIINRNTMVRKAG